MNMKIDTGWVARKQPGGIYCSPRCGCKCTQEAHDKAWESGHALVEKLGSGWEVIVWENCGWHYRVIKGLFEICAHGSGSFTAFYQSTPQFTANAETAEDAIGFLRQDMRTTIRRIEADLAD